MYHLLRDFSHRLSDSNYQGLSAMSMKDFLNTLFVSCESYIFFGFFDGRISSVFSRRRLKRLTCLFSFGKSLKSVLCVMRRASPA